MSGAFATPLLDRAAVLPPRGEHRHTLIFMHGLGDSSAGFASLFQSLPLPHTRVVLPNAPVQPVSVNGGARMPSWYDIYTLGSARTAIDHREDEPGIMAARASVQALVDEEVARLGGDASQLVIGGFSQGCAMALLAGLTSSHRLGGILGLSGYLLLRAQYPALLGAHASEVPILLYHGKDDVVVPFEVAKMSHAKLKELGLKVKFLAESGLGHSMSDDEIPLVHKWIQERFTEAQQKKEQRV